MVYFPYPFWLKATHSTHSTCSTHPHAPTPFSYRRIMNTTPSITMDSCQMSSTKPSHPLNGNHENSSLHEMLISLHHKLDFITDYMVHSLQTPSTTARPLPTLASAIEGIDNSRMPSELVLNNDIDKFFEKLEQDYLEQAPPQSIQTWPDVDKPSPDITVFIDNAFTDAADTAHANQDAITNAVAESTVPSNIHCSSCPIGSLPAAPADSSAVLHPNADLIFSVKSLQRRSPAFNDYWHVESSAHFGTRDPSRVSRAFLEHALSQFR